MRRRGWGWSLVGVPLALLLVGWGAWSTISLLGRSVTTEETAYEQPISVLEVHAAGSIRVRAADVEQVTVRERVERSVVAPDRSAVVEGDRLVLRSSCSAATTFCSVSYDVELPAGTALELRSNVGGIRVEGIDGPVAARSTAGGVTVTGGSGDLLLHSSAGGVRVEGSRADRVGASSTAGAVRVELLVAPEAVEARSTAGDVEVVVPRDETAYAVDTSGNDGSEEVQIRTDPSAPRTIRAETSAGGVTVRYP